MKLASKVCVLTLLLSLVMGTAASSAQTTNKRWAVISPEELPSAAGSFFHDLAEELGIDVEELKTAVQNAMKKRIEGLVRERRQEREGTREQLPDRRRESIPERNPDRHTIIIRPQIPNRGQYYFPQPYFPQGGTQRLRPGTQWRLYPDMGGMPHMSFRIWPGTGRR